MKNITWDQYFMGLAKISGLRSKDPNTKVGAALVNQDKRVVGLGYNGMPQGNDEFPWERDAEQTINTKYPYVIHAEVNAILNAIQNTRGTTLYVSLFPCSNCAKLIAQAGVQEIVFEQEIYKNTPDDVIAKKIFGDLKIKTRQIGFLTLSFQKQ